VRRALRQNTMMTPQFAAESTLVVPTVSVVALHHMCGWQVDLNGYAAVGAVLIVDISQSGQHGASSASELQCLRPSTTHKLTTEFDTFSIWKRGSSACCSEIIGLNCLPFHRASLALNSFTIVVSVASFVLQLTIGSD
jgi:hypothetical protein